jgi:hypothetical protein
MFNVNKKFLLLLFSAFFFTYIQGGDLPYAIFYGVLLVMIFGIIIIYIENKNIDEYLKIQKRYLVWERILK